MLNTVLRWSGYLVLLVEHNAETLSNKKTNNLKNNLKNFGHYIVKAKNR